MIVPCLALFLPLYTALPQESFNANNVDYDNRTVLSWLEAQTIPAGPAYNGLFNNISPKIQGVLAGVVLASPSTERPNYFYHWIRDAALTMDVVNTFYERGTPEFEQKLWEYAALSRKLQTLPTITGLGEPKFKTDATTFDDGWCRPQTDGPALTASTLMRFANVYMKRGGSVDRVRQELYDSKAESQTVIKAGLDYVVKNWKISTCDLWEEVRSESHFYTLMVQRRALVEGQKFATVLGDTVAAESYKAAATAIGKALELHWYGEKGYIVETPSDTSRTGLNAGTILAVIHTDNGNGGFIDQFSPIDDRVLVTVPKFIDSFKSVYPLNRIKTDQYNQVIGPAIGRYAEDIYDGVGTSQANPWYLATTAVAELYYRMVTHFTRRGYITVNPLNAYFFEYIGAPLNTGVVRANTPEFKKVMDTLVQRGDELIRRVEFHSDKGRLSEQYNKYNGFATGARDLTWSYAALITAYWAKIAL